MRFARRHRLAEAADRHGTTMRTMGRWPGCCGRGFGCDCHGERGLLVGGQMGPPVTIRQRCYLCGGDATSCGCSARVDPTPLEFAIAAAAPRRCGRCGAVHSPALECPIEVGWQAQAVAHQRRLEDELRQRR